MKRLQSLELGHAACFDKQCPLAVAGMQRLQELWLDGGRQGLAPAVRECWGMLHRCTQLQRLTLQRCGSMSLLAAGQAGHAAASGSALRARPGSRGCL